MTRKQKKSSRGHTGHAGHYCKICHRYRANEKFSGKGHRVHICKECMKLPVKKRNELQTVNKIINLPLSLNKGQQSWLEKMRKDRRAEIQDTAEWAYELRFPLTDESQCRCTQED